MPTALLGGSWGHALPENFGNFNSLRAFLMHSGSSFWTDLVVIFTRAIFCKHPELYCCNVWAYDKMGGGSARLVSKVGGLQPPCPPYFSAPDIIILIKPTGSIIM